MYCIKVTQSVLNERDAATLKRKTRISKRVKKRRIREKRDIWREPPPTDGQKGEQVFFLAHLPGPLGTAVSDLQVVEFGFERLDIAVGNLQVLVKTVTLGDELL